MTHLGAILHRTHQLLCLELFMHADHTVQVKIGGRYWNGFNLVLYGLAFV